MKPKPGRPPDPQGSGYHAARRMSLNLDAKSEAALAVLRTVWGEDSPDGLTPSATAIKRALVETARRVAPQDFRASVAEVRARRERDAA